MKVLYADTSALAKLYVAEAGTESMRLRAVGAEVVASSVLAWPETLAMLARRRREGLLSAAEHELIRDRFVGDFGDLTVVDLGGRVLELAERVLADHPLRSADAVHLASALLLTEAGLAVDFACSDRALLAAARAERLAAFDPAA